MFKTKYFQMYSVFSKKVYTKIFLLKPLLKRATNLERFVAVQ